MIGKPARNLGASFIIFENGLRRKSSLETMESGAYHVQKIREIELFHKSHRCQIAFRLDRNSNCFAKRLQHLGLPSSPVFFAKFNHYKTTKRKLNSIDIGLNFEMSSFRIFRDIWRGKRNVVARNHVFFECLHCESVVARNFSLDKPVSDQMLSRYWVFVQFLFPSCRRICKIVQHFVLDLSLSRFSGQVTTLRTAAASRIVRG